MEYIREKTKAFFSFVTLWTRKNILKLEKATFNKVTIRIRMGRLYSFEKTKSKFKGLIK